MDRTIKIVLGSGIVSLLWIGPRAVGWLRGERRKRAEVPELCRASSDERRRSLPGDEFVPQPKWVITHAITINAPPHAVWPWVIQMGSERAGWYAFDHIDNAGVPSARHVIPELQHVAPGDVLPALPGFQDAFIVREVMPKRSLVLVVPREPNPDPTVLDSSGSIPRASWAIVLEASAGGSTRLISRSRISPDWLVPQNAHAVPGKPIFIERVYGLMAKMPWALLMPFAGSGHYVMESRMLRGIKRRAEKKWAQEHTAESRSVPLEVLHGMSARDGIPV